MRGLCHSAVAVILTAPLTFGQVIFLEQAQELNITELDDSRGAAIIDLNDDGVNEILIINKFGSNRLYVRQGSTYIEAGAEYGIDQTFQDHNITVVDLDKNLLPDIYITGVTATYTGRFYINTGEPPFVERAEQYNLQYVSDMGSIFFQLTPESPIAILNGLTLKIFDDGSFIDITDGSGLENLQNVFTPICFDIDGDIDDDLFVAGNYELNWGTLFRNNGDGTFTDISTNTDEGGFGFGQSVTFGDIDNDGDFDLYLSSGYGTNTMWSNDGTGFFTNVTDRSNTGYGGYSLGANFGDFDNDGDLDLFVNRAYDYNVLFLNDGSGVFEDYTAEAGIMDSGLGCASGIGDLNNDGQLDIVAANYDYAPTQVYINQNDNESFLRVKLVGQPRNSLALGAIMKLYGLADSGSTLTLIGMREISSHPSYFGVNELVAHFGTGDYQYLRLKVAFQSLASVEMDSIVPGQTIVIQEPDATPVEEPGPALPEEFLIIKAYPNPFNSSVIISINGGSSVHRLAIYDLLGRLVKSADILVRQPSSATYRWDARNDAGQPVPSGIYLVRVKSGTGQAITKISLVR